MKASKKTASEVVKDTVSSSNENIHAVQEQPIALVTTDFHRDDMNALVETLNQVIKKVNK